MNEAKRILEAILFAASEPIPLNQLSDILSQQQAISPREVKLHLKELADLYDEEGRAFELNKIAGGYTLRSRKEFAPYLHHLLRDRRPDKLSRAGSEVLAIIAYRQPIIRAEVDAVRGVDSSGTLSALMERGLIRIVGRVNGPGRAAKYGTTPKFLKEFGLNDLDELPNREDLRISH